MSIHDEKNEQNTVELENEFIVLAVPSATLEVTIEAKVWQNGKAITVSRTMPFEEVRAAIEDAHQNYFPDDAVFTLTDLGREEAERLKAQCGYAEDT